MNQPKREYMIIKPVLVLIIEDNQEYLEMVSSILAYSSHPRFEVMTAENLDAGLALLAKDKPDVILLDMTLPDSNGMDTLRKTMTAAADLPIVMMTGHDDERLVNQALQEGAQDYLVKGQHEVALLSRAIHYAIERKRGQMALHASEVRFRQMIEKNADPIMIIDDQLVVRFANPAVAALFGRKPEAFVGTVFGFPLPLGDQTSEIEVIDVRGRSIVAEMRAVEIEWEGWPAHLASLRDITEHKYMLAELEQTRQQDLRVKDVFLSKVSHELRSPLSVIHQFTTILLDGLAGQLNAEQQEHLEIIFRNVEELRKMIDDLLQVSRAEIDDLSIASPHRSENLNMVSECTQVDDLVGKTLTMLRTIAAKKAITLTAQVDQDLPLAHADPLRIGQVLNNLVNNAIKFTPQGGRVGVRIARFEKDPQFLCVSVRDSGPGVPHKEKEKIFEYLYQADSAIDNKRKGLGIGLYISREIITRHGGAIWVDGHGHNVDGGEGSTFSFTLPIFSLEALVTKLLTPDITVFGNVGILTIDVFPKPSRKLTNQDEKVMSEVWNILRYCVLVDYDLVLPRLRRLVNGEVFFVLACSPPWGIDALIRRIKGQLRRCAALRQSDLVPTISVVTPLFNAGTDTDKEHLSQSRKIKSIVAQLNQLINEKVYQRRSADEQKENTHR
jgi:signal transduction histidine kinase